MADYSKMKVEKIRETIKELRAELKSRPAPAKARRAPEGFDKGVTVSFKKGQKQVEVTGKIYGAGSKAAFVVTDSGVTRVPYAKLTIVS